MSTIVQIPIEETPEASTLIDQLGKRPEMEAIIEHTRQTVPGLHSIEISVWYDHDEDKGPPHLVITGWRERGRLSRDDFQGEWDWAQWFIRAFPPDAKFLLSFEIQYRGSHGR